jgi:hypothetical protein
MASFRRHGHPLGLHYRAYAVGTNLDLLPPLLPELLPVAEGVSVALLLQLPDLFSFCSLTRFFGTSRSCCAIFSESFCRLSIISFLGGDNLLSFTLFLVCLLVLFAPFAEIILRSSMRPMQICDGFLADGGTRSKSKRRFRDLQTYYGNRYY